MVDNDLAVRWLNYDELAELRGTSRDTAKQYSFRRPWARQQDNQGQTKLAVPIAEIEKWARDRPQDSHEDRHSDGQRDRPGDMSFLQSQLLAARRDVDEAKGEATQLRERAARAEGQLEGVREAMAGLKAQLDVAQQQMREALDRAAQAEAAALDAWRTSAELARRLADAEVTQHKVKDPNYSNQIVAGQRAERRAELVWIVGRGLLRRLLNRA